MENQIINPWIIAHEPSDDGKLQVLIAGKPGAGYEQFGILIADIIRHVAAAHRVDEADVFAWVQKEMDEPSAKLEGGTVQ